MRRRAWDAIVVGSGFGGAMVAHELVRAGAHVLMLERGDWVERGPHNWEPRGARELSPHFTPETPYEVIDAKGRRRVTGSFHGVGGPSVFYGGVAMRLRLEDFAPGDEIVGDSGAAWPFDYHELAPWYDAAERILGVAGSDAGDPTAPPRSAAYPYAPAALSRPGRRIDDAARSLGLRPFRLPLAINYDDGSGRRACQRCTTCDGFACAIGAKNDLATGVLPALVAEGLELRPNTVAVELVVERGRVSAVECVDRRTGDRTRLAAARVVLAAGALATPHLLLASGLDARSPARPVVGRHLTRHRNALVFGVFPARANPELEFHKQVAIHDFYLGAPDSPIAPAGKLGGIQQITAPGADFVRNVLPRPVGHVLGLGIPNALGMLTIAEDQPSRDNGVWLDPSRRDRFGLPQLVVRHVYTPRDEAAGKALVREAGRVLRAAGAVFTASYGIKTFSHALGTVRMGHDEHSAPVDSDGAYRGVENLYVSDGSILPTSAGVNPSLTIAACALRIGAALAGRATASVPRATARQLPLAVVRAPDAR